MRESNLFGESSATANKATLPFAGVAKHHDQARHSATPHNKQQAHLHPLDKDTPLATMNGSLPHFMQAFGAGMPPIPPQQLARAASNQHFLPNASPAQSTLNNTNRGPPNQHMTMYVPPPPLIAKQSMSKDILKPHDHDVMCGRGGLTNFHRGNVWYRRLVRCNRQLYRDSAKYTKLLVSKAIVQAVQSQNPPGRFIECDKDTGIWHQIPYKKALDKTSQALREKDKEGDDDEDLDGVDLTLVRIPIPAEASGRDRMAVSVRTPPPMPPTKTTPGKTPPYGSENGPMPASMQRPVGPGSAVPEPGPFAPMLPEFRAMAPGPPGLPPALMAMPSAVFQMNMAQALFAQAQMNMAQAAQRSMAQGTTLGQMNVAQAAQRSMAQGTPGPAPAAQVNMAPAGALAPRTQAPLVLAPADRKASALDDLAHIAAVQAKALEPSQNQGTKRHAQDQTGLQNSKHRKVEEDMMPLPPEALRDRSTSMHEFLQETKLFLQKSASSMPSRPPQQWPDSLIMSQQQQQVARQLQQAVQQQQQQQQQLARGASEIPQRQDSQIMAQQQQQLIRDLQQFAQQQQQFAARPPSGTPQQGQFIMTPQQQDQFAWQLQQFAQARSATEFSRAVSQQGFAALAASQTPSLNRIEHSVGGSNDTTPLPEKGTPSEFSDAPEAPPLSRLTSQVSDWLQSFFPLQLETTETLDDVSDSEEKSPDKIDPSASEEAVPNPPELEHSVSEALLKLSTGPSRFFSNLSSIFDRSHSSGASSAPSSRLQSGARVVSLESSGMQQNQQQSGGMSQGAMSPAGMPNMQQYSMPGGMSQPPFGMPPMTELIRNGGSYPPKRKRPSLLDDYEETPMEARLRTVTRK